MSSEFKTITDYLLEQKCINSNTLQKSIIAAKKNNQGLIYYLAKNNIVSPEILVVVTAEIFHLEIIDLSKLALKEIQHEIISLELITRAHIIPLEKTNTSLKIALCDPSDLETLEMIKFQSGLNLNCFLARFDQIDYWIKKINTRHYTESLHTINKTSNQDQDQFEATNNKNEPLIRFVNDMLENAINKGASDIHFEPYENNYRIRFRLDGILNEASQPPAHIAQQLAARLKVMAKLDIAEHRLPQDGRCQFKSLNSHPIDLRVSSCPTLYGEKVVLRLLNSSDNIRDIHELHFNKQQHENFQRTINQSQGLVLVTGPTGSGKTVTLYAALKHLNTIEKNISTAEDPVEINLPGINQVNVNPKTGLIFSRALRAFLRQDPDIIMIGEIRDLETAEIAIKAAQTGHLVLSTLHTNSALETLSRLHNMGIALHDLMSAISLITAQRLARKLCPHCKKLVEASDLLKKEHGISTLYQAHGCAECTQGYRGRIAIHEVIPIDQTISEQLLSNQSILTTMDLIKQQGVFTLQQAAIEKVNQGETSLEEIRRVINF